MHYGPSRASLTPGLYVRSVPSSIVQAGTQLRSGQSTPNVPRHVIQVIRESRARHRALAAGLTLVYASAVCSQTYKAHRTSGLQSRTHVQVLESKKQRVLPPRHPNLEHVGRGASKGAWGKPFPGAAVLDLVT